MTNEALSAAASLDELLTRTQQALTAMRSQAVEHPDGADLLRAEGSAADGLVRATVVQGGRLASVTVEPSVAERGLDEICAHIVVAVNAALAELDARVSASARADVEALSDRLGGLREQSMRQMELASQAMENVLARLAGR